MRISKTVLRTAFTQPMQALIMALAHNQTRIVVDRLNVTPMVNNSTGTPAASLVAVPTQVQKGAVSGANLASRAAFNTAIGKVNDAVAVLAAYLDPTSETMQLESFTGGNGNVVAAGTVPALDKSVGAGVDGSGGNAMLRLEANQALTRARNNVATIVRVYNAMANGIGVATLENKTLGNASDNSVIENAVLANTAIAANALAGKDLALKANMDAALLALANNIATITARVNDTLLADATLAGIEPIILIP